MGEVVGIDWQLDTNDTPLSISPTVIHLALYAPFSCLSRLICHAIHCIDLSAVSYYCMHHKGTNQLHIYRQEADPLSL